MNYDNFNRFPGDVQSLAAIYMREEKEKYDIKYIGKYTGLGIIGYVVIQNLIGSIALFEPLRTLYNEQGPFFYAFVIILSIIGLLVPFYFCGESIKKKTGTEFMLFEKQVSTGFSAYAIGFGFFICLLANYITSWNVTFIETIGYKLTEPEYAAPADFFGRFLYILAIAVVPPLCEEVAVRGVVMQPLREYGDSFAVVTSAFVFAVLHGNLVQAPFAFICGIALGYVACITGSLRCGIIIHFLNNLLSVVIEFIVAGIADTEAVNRIYLILMAVLYIISISLSALFFMKKGGRKLNRVYTVISPGRKFAAFVKNIPMIISLIIMLVLTLQFVERV